MSEVPSAKRVKRSELFDNTRSEDEDPSSNTTHEAVSIEPPPGAFNYTFEYDFINQTTPDGPEPQTHSIPKETEVFAFNLFKPTSKPANTTSQPENHQTDTPKPQGNLISIRSPSPPPNTGTSTSGSFSRPRPDTDYFTSALPEAVQRELKNKYASSAISASSILALSRTPWPGASLSWRVVNVPAHRRQIVVHKDRDLSSVASVKKDGVGGGRGDSDRRRRPRPSKKRRLLLTARSRHKQMLIDQTKTKEEHEREKKNQKNRERKMKRRAKERKEKAEKGMATEVDAQT